MSPTIPRRWSWRLAPFLGIGATVVPNAIMIALSLARHPATATADREGGTEDAGIAARRRFAASHAVFAVGEAEGAAMCTLAAAGPLREARLRFTRPDSRAADVVAPWPDLGRELLVPLPRAGRWTVRLDGVDADGAAVAAVREISLP